MAEFYSAFMGHVGFDELKKHCKQGDDFSKEVLSILNERASIEQTYSKSLKRIGQRLSKACSNVICSPLSSAWRTICIEIDIEADTHKKYGTSLLEECVKPMVSFVDSQSKIRKSMEMNVESASKIMSDAAVNHTKLKKRQHQLSKEKETLSALVEGARPKTEKDQLKLVVKQKKTEELLLKNDNEYYESLKELQGRQIDWEISSKECLFKVQNLEQEKLNKLCCMAMSYSSFTSNLSLELNKACQQVKKACSSLDPEGEIRVITENKMGHKYQSEQILCDYYEENFSNQIKAERRVASLNKTLEKFLGDLQKERAHLDGMTRLLSASSDRSTEGEVLEMQQRMAKISSLITFLDVNKCKLQQAVATVNGNKVEPHPLTQSIEQRYDKQGIMHSTFKVPDEAGVDEVFQSGDNTEINMTRQRTQSFNQRTASYGSENAVYSSVKKGGTLTAKQIRGLSEGMGRMNRKQAPAPPVQNVPARRPSTNTCLVKYRYESRQADELSIEEGDVISVLEMEDADWWKGEKNGQVGIFPASYVDLQSN